MTSALELLPRQLSWTVAEHRFVEFNLHHVAFQEWQRLGGGSNALKLEDLQQSPTIDPSSDYHLALGLQHLAQLLCSLQPLCRFGASKGFEKLQNGRGRLGDSSRPRRTPTESAANLISRMAMELFGNPNLAVGEIASRTFLFFPPPNIPRPPAGKSRKSSQGLRAWQLRRRSAGAC